ncbi:hypothetical protein F5Y00DRAFT_223455 [Daldinia vernicosa]|uniref:uncharacterized protein n=1 Tax=Daldinia vernicosa TaxID=114800 RepID=UPI002008A8C5|nr:uncharacterized protein F5Y00DRAFT_223455 [Daldinia vernicosa]KAI0853735.1 hypothetical protein F5Y00DRAFT_223455 [Daldinia vernicosa]
MNSQICNHCRKALHQSLRAIRGKGYQRRPLSSTNNPRQKSSSSSASPEPESLETLFSKPTWSVRSLLPEPSSPTSTDPSTEAEITPRTLQHLLRLSALPPPSSPSEEALMLSTLTSQLHFVRAIRSVDTAGVEPLRAIRDETALGQREQTIDLEQLKDALANEDVVGHARRPRRRRQRQGGSDSADPGVEGWDVLAGASETAGRYFVVRTGSTGPARIGVGQVEKTEENL